jgi:hypothetical protein
MRRIPANLEFRLYSNLRKREKNDDLRLFLNAFSMEFGFGGINNQRNWRRRLDFVHKSRSSNTFQRDTLIAYLDRTPISAQQFYIPRDARSGYAEGIFVDEDFRERGIARVTREIVFAYLINRSIEIFYVGKSGNGECSRIKKSQISQGLARSDIEHARQAIVDLKMTPKKKHISSYGIVLARYKFLYGGVRARAGDL